MGAGAETEAGVMARRWCGGGGLRREPTGIWGSQLKKSTCPHAPTLGFFGNTILPFFSLLYQLSLRTALHGRRVPKSTTRTRVDGEAMSGEGKKVLSARGRAAGGGDLVGVEALAALGRLNPASPDLEKGPTVLGGATARWRRASDGYGGVPRLNAAGSDGDKGGRDEATMGGSNRGPPQMELR